MKSVTAFSFISVGYLFIDLSSCTIEKIPKRVALPPREKYLKSKNSPTPSAFVAYIYGKIIKSIYPINSLERQPVNLELKASDGFCRLSKAKFKTEHNFIEFYIL